MSPLAQALMFLLASWALFFALMVGGWLLKIPADQASNAALIAMMGFYIHSVSNLRSKQ